MKIAFYAPHFDNGGLERTNLNLAREFIRAGHTVELVTLSHTNVMIELMDVELKTYDLGARTSMMGLPAYLRYLAQSEVDIVISSQHYANVITIIAKLISRKNFKVILCERIALNVALANEIGMKKFLMPYLVKFAYPKAEKVVANSVANANYIEKFLNNCNVEVSAVYNPTYDLRILQHMKSSVDEEWLIDKKLRCIISLGRLSEQKDHATLIKAFASVCDKYEHLRLLIVGDGELGEDLLELCNELGCADKVKFLGFQSNPYKFLHSADLFVLSSRYEGLPNALIEAMICELPVIAADCETGPREILLDGKLGPLFAPGDYAELAKLLESYMENEHEYTQRVELYEKSLCRFRPENSSMQYLSGLV